MQDSELRNPLWGRGVDDAAMGKFIPASSLPMVLEVPDQQAILDATTGFFLVCKKGESPEIFQRVSTAVAKGLAQEHYGDYTWFANVNAASLKGPAYEEYEQAVAAETSALSRNGLPHRHESASTDKAAFASAFGPSVELLVTGIVGRDVLKALVDGQTTTRITPDDFVKFGIPAAAYWLVKWLQTSANLGVRTGLSPRILRSIIVVAIISALIPLREVGTDFTALTAAGEEHGLIHPGQAMHAAGYLAIFTALAMSRGVKIALADMANVFRNSGHALRQRSPHWLRTAVSKLIHLCVERPMGLLMLGTYMAAWLNIPMTRYYFGASDALPLCDAIPEEGVEAPANMAGKALALTAGLVLGSGEYFMLTSGHAAGWLRRTSGTLFPNASNPQRSWLLSAGDLSDRTGPVYQIATVSTEIQLAILRKICCCSFDGSNPIAERLKLHHGQKTLFRGGMFVGVAAQLYTLFAYGTIEYCVTGHSDRIGLALVLAFMFFAGCFNGYKEFQEPQREMVWRLCARYPEHVGHYLATAAGERILREHLHNKHIAGEALSEDEQALAAAWQNRTRIVLRADRILQEWLRAEGAAVFFQNVLNGIHIGSGDPEAGREGLKAALHNYISSQFSSYPTRPEDHPDINELTDLFIKYCRCCVELWSVRIKVAAAQMPHQLADQRCGLVSWWAPDAARVPYLRSGEVNTAALIAMQNETADLMSLNLKAVSRLAADHLQAQGGAEMKR